MLSVGDKVLYPMHGAGTIVGIEEKKILGEKKHYYVFELPTDEIDVMIPVESSDAIGVRPIVSKEAVEQAVAVLEGEKTAMDENWNRRYRDNMDKLKSGDIYMTVEVVRDLSHLAKTRTLSQGEAKIREVIKEYSEFSGYQVDEADNGMTLAMSSLGLKGLVT